MTYKAIDIANWFVSHLDRDAGDAITPLKLQKLLYYAEAWSQTLLEQELFQESIQAWTHGPVVPEVFEHFKHYKWNAIEPNGFSSEIDPDIEEVLKQVINVYGEFSAKTLESMTHNDQPWIDAHQGFDLEERCTEIIPKPKIKQYFTQKYKTNSKNGEEKTEENS